MSTESIREAVEQAEEFADPLEGIVEKAMVDPGAPFLRLRLGISL